LLEQSRVLDHVLVVDDDPILCAIAESHFKKRGAMSVQTASDGMMALDRIAGDSVLPTLLMCDLNMPNMDGIEFLRHLEQQHFEGAIVIVSSEHESVISMAEKLAKVRNLNIVGTLSKPLDRDALDKLVRSAVTNQVGQRRDAPSFFSPTDILAAINNKEILAYYQPKVDANSGVIGGVEALARWHHPTLGMITPDHFIPIVEQNGLIGNLTDIILNNAIADMKSWSDGNDSIKCSINLTTDLLKLIDLPDLLAERIDASGLERSNFIFEITESSLLEKSAAPMEVLARMRIMGFELSIDDFGTGHSNIENLRDFPFNELKIDRSFVTNLDTDEFSQESVRVSIQLSRMLGLRIVAEGIETQNVLELIAKMGVDQAQGYMIGKPMPPSDFRNWLMEFRNRRIANFGLSKQKIA